MHIVIYMHIVIFYSHVVIYASHVSRVSLPGSTVYEFRGSLYDTVVVYKVTDHFYVNTALSWHDDGTDIPCMIYDIIDHVHRCASGRSMRTSGWT